MHPLPAGKKGGWGRGKQRWESRCGKSIELKWTYLSVGKENSRLIELLNCYWGKINEDTCVLNQCHKNYLIITWEMLPTKNWHFWFAKSFVAAFTDFLAIYLLDLVHNFHGADGVLFCKMMSLIREGYCIPPQCAQFICFLGKVYYSHMTIGLACSDKREIQENFHMAASSCSWNKMITCGNQSSRTR